MAAPSRRKKTPAKSADAPARKKLDRSSQPLAKGWYDAVLVDCKAVASQSGMAMNRLEFEVTSPRLYAGRRLSIALHEKLDKMLFAQSPSDSSLENRFPDIDFLDADDTWNSLGGTMLRISVDIEQREIDGKTVPMNRVVSFYEPTERKPKEDEHEANAEAPI